jgi:hypothetical protein
MAKQMKHKQAELTRRGAAAMAHQTAGMSRILTPNKKTYNRKRGKAVEQ